jgi:hypothetical protein
MRSEIFAAISFVFAWVASMTTAAQNVPVFQFMEKPGPHAVGLKVVKQFDYSRIYRSATDELGKPYTGERARPLQTLVWYPAEKSAVIPGPKWIAPAIAKPGRGGAKTTRGS